MCSPEADTVCTANLTEVLFLCGFVVSAWHIYRLLEAIINLIRQKESSVSLVLEIDLFLLFCTEILKNSPCDVSNKSSFVTMYPLWLILPHTSLKVSSHVFDSSLFLNVLQLSVDFREEDVSDDNRSSSLGRSAPSDDASVASDYQDDVPDCELTVVLSHSLRLCVSQWDIM